MEKYYFAYGSNLNVEQMRQRCPDARPLGVATINNYQLLFKGSRTGSYLTIEPCDGKSVPVGVWSISDADERNLDLYEGFPRFYYKAIANARVRLFGFSNPAYQKIKGLIYIMHKDRPIGIPSNFYVQTCKQGYKSFGFDESFLEEALRVSRENCGKTKIDA